MEIVNIPIDDLTPFEGNPRLRTERVLDHLVMSIREFGFVDPVIIWANAEERGCPANTVIGGHRRLDAYRVLIEKRTKKIFRRRRYSPAGEGGE